MHFKLVLLAAHLGFALASPAGSGVAGSTSDLQVRDAPQSTTYDDGSYHDKGGDTYGKQDDHRSSGYNKDGSYNGQGYGDDKYKNAYPHGQDSYNPGRIDHQGQDQKTDSGPADSPYDVNKQWDGQGAYSHDDGKDKGHYDQSTYDQHAPKYGPYQKGDYGGDKSKAYGYGYDGHHDDKGKQYGGEGYSQKTYENGYDNHHDDKGKQYGGEGYSQKGYDDHHCPDRQHAVPFTRPNDDHEIIGYFFEHEQPQTFNLFAIYNEHTDDYFYTIDLAEKIIYMKQFGFEKDKGIIGYIFHDYGCGGVPLYRVFNRHDHKYYFTTSEEKKHAKLGAGWEDGGITGYIYKRD